FGIDRLKNPRRAVIPGEVLATSGNTDEPTIRIWLNETGCSGCLTGLQKRLSEVPWLSTPKVLDKLPTTEDSKDKMDLGEHAQLSVVEIKVAEKNVTDVDFVAVLAALRKAGFAPAQVEFSGLPHYRLEADLAPMCSPGCVEGTRETMDKFVRANRP